MANKLIYDPALNYRLMFTEEIIKSKLIDEKINMELYYLDDLPYSLMEKYGDEFKRAIVATGIDYVMMNQHDNQQKREKASYVSMLGIVKRFMLYRDGLIIETHNGQRCEIQPLSPIVEDEKIAKKLVTEERRNDCHNGSWELMESLSNIKDKKLVSGFIKGSSNESVYPHTWIEFVDDGEEKVIDYTLNAVMNKEFYYTLRSIDRENICEIFESDFQNEKPVVENMCKNDNLDKRIYLIFHKDFVENNLDKFQNCESKK